MMQKKFGSIICVAVLLVGLGLTIVVGHAAAGGDEDDSTNNMVNATQTDAQTLNSCNGTQTVTSDTGPNSGPCPGGGTHSTHQARLRGKLNNTTCVNAFCGVNDGDRPVDSSEEMDDDVINATVSKGSHSHQHQHRSHLLPSPVGILVSADEEAVDAALEYGGKKVVLKAEVLKHTSVLYGLISIAERDELSERCYRELQRVYHGIQQKEIWAMKVLDASGSQESGFMWGHNHWIGSEKGCESTRTPLSITLSDRYRRNMKRNLVTALAPFELDYRIVFAKHQSAWQVDVKFQSENILHIGVCIPRSCTNDELHNLTARYFDENLVLAQDIYEFKPNVLHVKNTTLDRAFWLKPSIFIIGLSLAFTLLMVYMAHSREQRLLEEKNNNHPSGSTTAPATAASTNGDLAEETTFLDRVIDSFNVRKNLNTIFRTDTGPQSLPVICGMKSICCFLILCFHMQWYTFYTVHNPSVMLHYAEQIRFQLVSNAPLLVDVFFAISGFLLSYNFIRNRSKVQEVKANTLWENGKLYGKMLLHRYLRLSPMYLFVTVLGELTHSYIVETSKFWVHERSDLGCQRYWWRNLFYIQNLYPVDDFCLSWTWSLACEMQYYMLFTILLFVYAKSSKFGKKMFGVFAIGTLLFNIGLTLNYRFIPSYDVLYNTGDALYTAPWSRVSPYVVGVYFGWLMASSRDKFTITQNQYRWYWLLACFCVIFSMHSTIKRNFPFPIASTVMVAVRWLISWAACWVILATGCGYSNLVTRVLSSKFFVHINKLTYGIYLLNPLIIIVTFGVSDSSAHADPIPAIVMAFGVTLLSYMAAIVFSAFFEIPYCRISNEILKLNRKVPIITHPSPTSTSGPNHPSFPPVIASEQKIK
ncbi:nose resistant to fluoxetine protein 6-like [Anopheles maculipalpis]|uniref:nose resistant to fluoxetine protein 6-like n=1 Tax=Anopheles maculipalpis TaxID=1496333 RepID=UPI0021599ABF|nr:nose resistant to fluoxetine protein 6-like [Anopheles maculipalpis]